ncbi:MAG: phosphoribosylamine--glycine ligase [Thermomicrobiales bacterium]
MRVMVVGNGAREHALLWKLARSPLADTVCIAPGNAGTTPLGENIPIKANDLDGIVGAARARRVDLVVIGPEEPLALGLADRLEAAGIAVCGPSQAAARIESSKAWAKEIMARAGVPTARSVLVRDVATGRAALGEFGLPVVVKADGLAAGKGVVIAETTDQAVAVLTSFLHDQTLGAAGATVLIEECLVGQEVSVFALTDGETVIILPAACDYKRIFDGDKGPNTGGMGAYAPPPVADDAFLALVQSTMVEPVLRGMSDAGSPMRGILYAGLIVTADGPKIIEFNARFGDPEAQVVMPILAGDLLDLFWGIATGTLGDVPPPGPARGAAVCVVIASGGYPGAYKTGFPIAGLEQAGRDALVFHAGTRFDEEGRVVTAGGRILSVVGRDDNLADAYDQTYAAAASISFEGCQYRRDIAAREIVAG